MTPVQPTAPARTRPAAPAPPRVDAARPAQDQPVPADRTRDQRLQRELTEHAADTTAARHRDGLTAIASDADGMPEDEGALDAAAALEADAQQARSRQPGEDG